MPDFKICKGTGKIEGCGELKPITDFHVNKNTRTNMCTECTSIHKRARYAASRDDTSMDDVTRLAVCGRW